MLRAAFCNLLLTHAHRCHSLMESLPDALGGLSSLTHLTIETASLPYLPDSVGHLGSLRELVLSYCHCLQVRKKMLGLACRLFACHSVWLGDCQPSAGDLQRAVS